MSLCHSYNPCRTMSDCHHHDSTYIHENCLTWLHPIVTILWPEIFNQAYSKQKMETNLCCILHVYEFCFFYTLILKIGLIHPLLSCVLHKSNKRGNQSFKNLHPTLYPPAGSNSVAYLHFFKWSTNLCDSGFTRFAGTLVSKRSKYILEWLVYPGRSECAPSNMRVHISD